MNFNLQQMMKQMQTQAQELQRKLDDIQIKLENIEIEGVSGGGKVKITANAKGKVKGVHIDPSLFIEEEKVILEDLIVAALSNVNKAAENKAKDYMSQTGISPELLKMSGLIS